MIATWMLYAIVVGAFVIVAASALDRAARFTDRPARHIWAVGLALAILLPVALPFVSPSSLPGSTATGIGPAVSSGLVEVTRPTGFDAFAAASRNVIERIDRPLVFGWALLTAILLWKVIGTTMALRRRRAGWLEREIEGERLFVTPDLGPAVIALPETRVVIPEWILSFDAASLATVIRHERQHRLAGDLRLIIAGSVAAALMPWNPAVWYLRRRLRLAVEMDCDARVLAEDPRVDRYGSLLLAIAQHPRLAPRLSVTLAESTSDLERRIDAMTSRPPNRPRVRAALLSTLALAAIAFACTMPAPDATGPDRKSETAASGPDGTFEFVVDQPATVVPGNAPPRYPRQLRAANVEGEVIARFVVDTNGRVDMKTFEVVNSTHDAFTASVREMLPFTLFTPASVRGQKIKQLVSMPFRFSLSRDDTRVVPAEALERTRRPLVFEEVAVSDVATGKEFPELITRDAPNYPDRLREANIEGQVVASFTVMPDGKVDMSTFELFKSDHDLFTKSVRSHVERMRFRVKPDASGRRVPTRMTMPFMFSLSK